MAEQGAVSDIYIYELYKLENLNKTKGHYSTQKQYEITLIYIGSSTCQFCNEEKLPIAFKKINRNLKTRTSKYGFGFKVIGIAKDYIVTNGLAHLAKFGGFDEVMTGNDWSNTGLLRYVYGEIPGRSATPQILVVRRKFGNITVGNVTDYRGIEKETLLIRKVGLREIFNWSEHKAYLPEGSLGFGELY